MSKASVPTTFWPFAFAVSVYLINRMPTPLLSMESPFSKLFGTVPNYQKLRVFGCSCYLWLKPYTRHKLQNKSARCVFLGYSATQSAYLCYDNLNDRLYVSRHVTFDENTFPFASPPMSTDSTEDNIAATDVTSSPVATVLPTHPPSSDPHCHFQSPPPVPEKPATSPLSQVSPLYSESASVSSSSEPTAPNENGLQPTAQTNPNPVISNTSNPTHIPEAQINPSSPPTNDHLSPTKSVSSQPQTEPPQPPPNTHPMSTRAKHGITKPNTKYVYASHLTSHKEPTTINQAR